MARKGIAPSSWSMISFRKPVPTFRDHAVILAMLVAAMAGASAAPGEDCLAGPNAPSPAGSHWFYRIDHATHRKCWYLGDANRRRAGAAQTRAARRSVAAPPEPEEAPAPPQVPPRETAPDPGFGTRWPEAAATPGLVAPGAMIAAAPERLPAAAAPGSKSPGVIAERIGTRVVTTERVHNEPAPAKPQEPAKPQAAAPVAAATAGARGGLPAALLGMALLLAAVGTMLVLARRRLMTARDVYVARGPDESAAHERSFFDRVRRGLDESGRSPDTRSRIPLPPSRSALRRAETAPELAQRAETGRSMRAAEAPDIAAATLQPAIDPLPEEPIEAPADVEQSLRQLLAAWERRAA
jgi:hypothetical protein